MKSIDPRWIAVGALFALVLVQGVQAENYGFVARWGSNGSADGQFYQAYGLGVDSAGNVYVADNYNSRVQKFTSDGTFVSKFGSYGTDGGQFYYTSDVAVNSSGYIYVLDVGNYRVERFTPAGSYRGSWGSFGTGIRQFYYPTRIAIDAAGYVYVTDAQLNRTQKFTPEGGFVTQWGSTGTGNGEFGQPIGIAVDAAGYVYIADSQNNRVQKFTSGGAYVAQWGTLGTGNGQLDQPSGLDVDPAGNVFVSEYGNSRVQKFTSDGTYVTKWGSNGDGDMQFRNPLDVAATSSAVYVINPASDGVQEFAPVEGYLTVSCDVPTGPPGAVLTCHGANTYGDSPDYYTNILVTNNSPPYFTGSLPANGVRPDAFSVKSISGVGSTFVRAPVTGGVWSYSWDTSSISGGSVLPGSEYYFIAANESLNVTDARARLGTYVQYTLGIQASVHADFTFDASQGKTVRFTDTSTGLPTNVNIDFGDGDVAGVTPGGTVTHSYKSQGEEFTATLTAGNSLGSDSMTKDIVALAVTRDDAYAAVLHDPAILGDDITGKSISASLNPLPAGSSVVGWAGTFGLPNTNGWIIFVDDHPKANWEHPVRYVHVDNNNVRTVFQGTSPAKNIQMSHIAGEIPPVGGTNDVGGGYTGGYTGGGGGSASCPTMDCTHCYAVLISGGFDRDNNYVRYWNDLSAMYRTLRGTYCYPKDHIYVLMSDGNDPGLDQRTGSGATDYADSNTDLDGDGISDVNGAATKQDVIDLFAHLNGASNSPPTLGPDDNLFIFTTNHGGEDPSSDRVRLWLWGSGDQQFIWDSDFTALLANSPAKAIIMTMEQCYGGGFVDDFISSGPAGQTRVIATAADAVEPSYGNDFSFWWIDGVAGINGATGPANLPPSGNNDKLISLREGFEYAKANDPSAAAQPEPLEHPQYQDAVANAGASLGLSSCAMCPAPSHPLPDQGSVPADPKGWGFAEDLDNSGIFDVQDVVLYFNNMEWMADPANEPTCAFDTNGNGRIDFADVVNLYQGVQ